MVYKENFVVAIKSNGKILREFGDTVYLPFGSEYSVLLKNLNSVSAVADIDIDGTNAGRGIIIRSNSSSELKGFLEGCTVKNKFKFIQKTDEISDYRGDRVDDGIVRVEYKFEKKYEPVTWYYPLYYTSQPCYRETTYWCNCNNSDGITVKGSDVRQDFKISSTNPLENTSFVISLILKGSNDNKGEIKEPITTKTKNKCPTCGRTAPSSDNFCPNCGTRLI